MSIHGDSRNHHYVTESNPVHFQTIDTGQPIVVHNSHSYSVSDRWCEVCKAWVEAKGIMGALLCPECDAPWNKSLWHSPAQPRDPEWNPYD